MQQLLATVTHREIITPAWWQLTFEAPQLSGPVAPGQFFLLRSPNCYLRRPIFPQPLPEGRLRLLLRPAADRGLAWLSARQPGDALDLIGPLGCGFSLADPPGNLLLASDSQLLSPLLGLLERALAAGAAVTLLLSGRSAAAIYPAARLSPAVELQATTTDGSLGHHGPADDLLPALLAWADAVSAVGSSELYRTLQQQTRQVRLGASADFLFGLVAPPLLPCGVGACFGCALRTQTGSRLACVDGPVLDLMAHQPEPTP